MQKITLYLAAQCLEHDLSLTALAPATPDRADADRAVLTHILNDVDEALGNMEEGDAAPEWMAEFRNAFVNDADLPRALDLAEPHLQHEFNYQMQVIEVTAQLHDQPQITSTAVITLKNGTAELTAADAPVRVLFADEDPGDADGTVDRGGVRTLLWEETLGVPRPDLVKLYTDAAEVDPVATLPPRTMKLAGLVVRGDLMLRDGNALEIFHTFAGGGQVTLVFMNEGEEEERLTLSEETSIEMFR